MLGFVSALLFPWTAAREEASLDINLDIKEGSAMPKLYNRDLRKTVVSTVFNGKDGHIPSALSILDILDTLYGGFLKVDAKNPSWVDRDYFVLSKGHGCVALYSVLAKYGFITAEDLKERFCRSGAILGEHPDCNKVPGVEASTGSLGHGFPFAVGIALGLRIKSQANRVICVVGDGECQEGTVWEAASVAANKKLGRLCVFVDWNGSAAQLLPLDDVPAKWKAFGWNVQTVDGHNPEEIRAALARVSFDDDSPPSVIVARTTKGRGISFIEGHGAWHHRIPTLDEYNTMIHELEGQG
jgi:transketolase